MACEEIPLDCGPPRLQNITLLTIAWNILLRLVGRGPWAGGIPVSFTAAPSVERTPYTEMFFVDGASPAGATSVLFGLPADFEGTINGTFVTGANFASIPFVAPDGDTLPAIAFTIEAGSLLVVAIS